MNKVFLLSFLLAFSFELIIKNTSEPECSPTGKTIFNIIVEKENNDSITDKDSPISLFFHLNGTNNTNQYVVQCLIPIQKNEATKDAEEKRKLEGENDKSEEKEDENEKEKEKEEEEEKYPPDDNNPDILLSF